MLHDVTFKYQGSILLVETTEAYDSESLPMEFHWGCGFVGFESCVVAPN